MHELTDSHPPPAGSDGRVVQRADAGRDRAHQRGEFLGRRSGWDAIGTVPERRSLENRAQTMVRTAPPTLPDPEKLKEMEDAERERLKALLDAFTLAGNVD